MKKSPMLKEMIKNLSVVKYFRRKYLLKKLRNGMSYKKFHLFQTYNESVIFIHIPKAAGMSVVKAVYGKDASHHASAHDYITQDPKKYDQTFSFCVVRNPYERLYSAYNYLSQGGKELIDEVWHDIYLSEYNDFESFILDGGLKKAVLCNAEHFIPQFKFIYTSDYELLCDYVGRLESIETVEEELTLRLNRKVQFDQVNVTHEKQKMNLNQIYSKDMLREVNKIYEVDFKLLGYELLY